MTQFPKTIKEMANSPAILEHLMPEREARPKYQLLGFAHKTPWGVFVTAYAAGDSADTVAPVATLGRATPDQSGRDVTITAEASDADIAEVGFLPGRENEHGSHRFLGALPVAGATRVARWDGRWPVLSDGETVVLQYGGRPVGAG